MPEPGCGNGIVDEGEECEDNNDDDTDACVNCMMATCGDGAVYDGFEDCDDGNEEDEDACKSDCTPNVCGDGVVNPAAEECDDGDEDDLDGCRNDCTEAFCGDGVVDATSEECDDGDVVQTNDCKNDCTFNVCGDGVTHAEDEECDDGNDDNTDACTTSCNDAACGDGFEQLGEQCDDGGNVDYDGCSSMCAIESNCFDWGDSGCPTGATGYCVQGNVNCESEADATIACEVCNGIGACTGTTVCSDSGAVGPSMDVCPLGVNFVWNSAICSAGNMINECPNGGSTNGPWCNPS